MKCLRGVSTHGDGCAKLLQDRKKEHDGLAELVANIKLKVSHRQNMQIVGINPYLFLLLRTTISSHDNNSFLFYNSITETF